jgi:antirestriction protein ArdC
MSKTLIVAAPKKTPVTERADIHTRVTNQIISMIERGVEAFRMPWHHDGTDASHPVNVESRKAYRGVNVLALWIAAFEAGYPTGLWGTYRQWRAVGAQVRKGEHGSLVVFWKIYGDDQTQDNQTDHHDGRRRFLARGYVVFNAHQVDGYAIPDTPRLPEIERHAAAERFFDALGIATIWGGNRAFYRRSTDTVHLPRFDAFRDVASAYSVRAHECAHATGAPHRLGRELPGRFGSASYAMDELVAQLTAAYVLADLGIANEPRPDDATYISSWLKALRNEPRAIFTAVSQAQAAADWMHARQGAAPERRGASDAVATPGSPRLRETRDL